MGFRKPVSFEEFVLAQVEKQDSLTEASLSRLIDHMNKGDVIAIITGYRTDQTVRQNTSANKQIAAALRRHGFGFHKAVGGYVEDVHRPDGAIEQVDVDGERSMIVYASPKDQDVMFNLVKSLGHRFKQDSVLLVDKNNQACWYYTNDTSKHKHGDVVPLGEFHAKLIGKYYTKINKKHFVFKTLEEAVKWNWTTIEMRTNDQMRRNLEIATHLGVDYYEYLNEKGY